MSALALLARARLDRASSRGVFDDFKGKGKPFHPSLFDNPHAGEWELAFHLLRQADLAPRWIELDKDIRRGRDQFRRWLRLKTAESKGEPRFKVLVQAEREVNGINDQIKTRNLLAPASIRPLFRLRLEKELELARAETTKQEADHDGRLAQGELIG